MAKRTMYEEQAVTSDTIVKVTALVYLKEALLNQEYESCAELIATARNLGAAQGEIDDVIASYLRRR